MTLDDLKCGYTDSGYNFISGILEIDPKGENLLRYLEIILEELQKTNSYYDEVVCHAYDKIDEFVRSHQSMLKNHAEWIENDKT